MRLRCAPTPERWQTNAVRGAGAVWKRQPVASHMPKVAAAATCRPKDECAGSTRATVARRLGQATQVIAAQGRGA